MAEAKCNHDCFNCPFPDCIEDDISLEEWNEATERDWQAKAEQAELESLRDGKKKKQCSLSEAAAERQRVMKWWRYHNDPEYRKAVQAQCKKYYEAHREEWLKWLHLYQQTHKDEIRARQKEYRECHKEEIKAKKRAYRQSHKEQIKASGRAYYQANKEAIDAKTRIYREANKEKIRARKRAWYQAHKDEISAKDRARYQANKDEINARARAKRAAKRAAEAKEE